MAPKQQKLQAVPALERYKYLLVFLFAFLLYANTIPNQFNLDDELVTTTDEQYPHRITAQGIGAIPDIFTEPYYKDASGYAYDYRPIVLSTYAIERTLTGGNVHASHFINALLYGVLCLVLLWTLTFVLSGFNPLLPLIATLLFTAFPLHTEVVASLKNRDEILALLFALFSLRFAYKATVGKAILNLSLALMLFALALLSKQTIIAWAVLIPIVLVLLTSVNWRIPVIFALVATLIYLPLSPLATFFASTLFLVFMLLLVIGVYITRHYDRLFLPAFLKLPAVAAKESDTSTVNFLSFEVKLFPAIGVMAVLLLSSAILYLYNKPFYFVPLSLLLLLPYIVAAKLRPYAFALVTVVGVLACLLFWPCDGLVAAFMVYLLLATCYYRTIFYIVLPLIFVAGLATRHTVATLNVVAVILAVLSAVIWLPRKNIAGYIVGAIVLLSNLFFVFSSPSRFVAEEVYTLDILNVLVVIVFAILPALRRFLWLPAALGIIAMVFISNRQGSFVDVSGRVNAIANKEIPQVIEVSKIDRPISIAEAVTTPKSSTNEKLGTAAQVFRSYFRLTLLPYPMAFYYGYKEIDRQPVFTAANILTLFVFAALLLLALFLARRQAVVAAGLLIYLIGIGIYSNYLMPVPGMMADRFLFVPSLGFVLLLAWLLMRFTGVLDGKSINWNWQQWPTSLKGALLGLLVGYSILTVWRNNQWENHLTLFSADINHISNSAQANNLYAVQLMKYSFKETDVAKQQQMRATAELHFKKAVELFPPFFNAWYDLARTQNLLGKNTEAEANFVEAAKLNPAYATAWLSAGELALMRKQPRQARSYYLLAMDTIKNDPAFYVQLSFTYFLEAKYDSANVVNKEGMRLFPGKVDFPSNIAQTFAVINRTDSALYYYNLAQQLDPSSKAIQDAITRLKAGSK